MHTNEMTEATTGTVQNCKALYAKLRTQEDGVERTRLDLAREIHKALVEPGMTQVILGEEMGCNEAYVWRMNKAWLMMKSAGVESDSTRVQEFYRKAQEPTPDYPGKPGPKPAAKPVATSVPETHVIGNTPDPAPVAASGCPVEQGKDVKALKGVLDAYLMDCDEKSAIAIVDLLEKYTTKFNRKR